MTTATITSKGQITIPKEVRDSLRIGAGDRVTFLIREDGVVELRPETIDLADLYGILAPARRKVSVEEMNRDVERANAESMRRSSTR